MMTNNNNKKHTNRTTTKKSKYPNKYNTTGRIGILPVIVATMILLLLLLLLSYRSIGIVEGISLWSSSNNHNNNHYNNNNNNNHYDSFFYHHHPSKRNNRRNTSKQQQQQQRNMVVLEDDNDTNNDDSLVLYVSSQSQSKEKSYYLVPSTRGGDATMVIAEESSTSKKSNNMILSLVFYVKDSIQQTIVGLGELYTNHQKCNTIRAKQKQYRAAIVQEWLDNDSTIIDSTANNNNNNNIKERRKKEYEQRANKEIQGGISYEEYIFLQNGKLDRGKVLNMAFLMFGAPKFLPYAIMFNKENMLPSVFNRPPINKLQQLVIERSYILLRTLMDLEKDYTTLIQPAGGSASSNNFLAGLLVNKKKVEEQNTILKSVYDKSKQYYLLNSGESSSNPSSILALLAPHIYKIGTVPPPNAKNNNAISDDYTRNEKNLCTVPKSIVRGIADAITGTSNVGIFSIIQPHFLRRQKVLGHIQKIQQADDFIINANIDLITIPDPLLADACADRFISPPCRIELQKWLHCTVVQPQAIEKRIIANSAATTSSNTVVASSETSASSSSASVVPSTKRLYYNSNLARMALLVYYGCRGIQNYHSQQTTLPRLVLMGSGGSSSSSSSSTSGGQNE